MRAYGIFTGVLLITAVIILLGVWSSNNPTTIVDVSEDVNLELSQSADIPIRSSQVASLSLTGRYIGTGQAKVFIFSEEEQILVFDSALSNQHFEQECLESCQLPAVNVEGLHVTIFGNIKLFLDSIHTKEFSGATGLVTGCKNCQKVKPYAAPSPAVVLPIVWLLVAIIGAFALRKCCVSRKMKQLLALIHMGGVVLLVGLTATTAFSPTGAFVSVGETTNVFAILAIVLVLGIGAYEYYASKKQINIENFDWNDKWERK